MVSFHTSVLISIAVSIVILHGAWSDRKIKCHICNTADPLYVSEEICRHPNKYSNFTPTECTPETMVGLRETWMDEIWNYRHNSYPEPLNREPPAWPYVWQETPGYTLKCMKEVLHKDSKPWLKNKPAHFSQIVRFCEYRKDNENPPCETPCTSQQLTTGACYLCCSGDGCNGELKLEPPTKTPGSSGKNRLEPAVKILTLARIFTLPAFLKRAFGIEY